MKYYATIDTNVFVSALLKKDSYPGKIIDLVMKGEIIPLINNQILEEYEDVLFRKEFSFNIKDVKEFIKRIRFIAIVLNRTTSDELFIDEDDRVFYEITLTAKSLFDAYLITGNIRHFPSKSFVLTPKQMIEKINIDK